MNALVNELVQKAQLSNEQAQKAADVVKGFVGSRVPEGMRGTVESALTGERVQGTAEALKSKLGGSPK